MSSTEQKNITQPFIDACYSFGILPTILTGAFDNYELNTGHLPFEGLGSTPNFGARLRNAEDPVAEAKLLLPTLRNAGPVTRASPLLLRLCTDSRVYSGNQAVCRFAEAMCVRRWGIHVMETGAFKHAKRHSIKIAGMLAPGAYSTTARMRSNMHRIQHRDTSAFVRCAADVIDLINRGQKGGRHTTLIRKWCTQNRECTGLKSRYTRIRTAISDFRNFCPQGIHESTSPPSLKQKWFSVRRDSGFKIEVYNYGSQFIFRIVHTYVKKQNSALYAHGKARPKDYQGPLRQPRQAHETYFFNRRDLDDLRFLLTAASHVRLYFSRRRYDCREIKLRRTLSVIQDNLWGRYLEVMRACGGEWSMRNKLGVYFDVLQWRYLAWRSGDIFYNHSQIMAQKIVSKGLSSLPPQEEMLGWLKQLPMDISVDLLGLYKASVYPEVDPFDVVCQQRKLHYSRHNTDWAPGSAEAIRFEDTRAYMWYLGVRVMYDHEKAWPGKIRQGVEHKHWHDVYKRVGIPGNCWRDSHDIDLTGCVPVSDISNEQYFRQQDSACAPPHRKEYADFEAMQQAPRRHRRKLLYAIQEPDLPDLPLSLNHLNMIGAEVPDGYVGELAHDLPFSVDIVTGSRCERHKDAPRPFYAASSPWGCILSYFDGITRDFLQNVPQSMLGKSTRQKFLDLQSTARHLIGGTKAFYMSDDKAKYSPRMDPRSQQMPAEFFAEIFDIPGMRAFGPIMYHCELYYRVCGHLVHYNSNGTDREGMRGASNTWLEIVAQGLTTRLSREKKLIRGKSIFLSFIDDGLRKFSVEMKDKTDQEVLANARLVIEDVIFGLKVLGRELSWDKTFVSCDLFVMLNEIMYDESHFSSGLKSFCTVGDIEMKEVMSAADYEQNYFGKLRGAHGVGAPLDLCHYVYLFETLASHYTMGGLLQDNKQCSVLDYRLFCITPLALGGGGIRSMLQLGCNEVANATKEGIGNIMRMGANQPVLSYCVQNIINQPLEQIHPIDFMREPLQFHVSGPRIKTQRLAGEVRKHLTNIANNDLSKKYVLLDREGQKVLESMGRILMSTGDVSAEEVRLLYSSTPMAFVDEFIQKLAASTTLSEILGRATIALVRKMVRRDLLSAMNHFRKRSGSDEVARQLSSRPQLRFLIPELLR